MNDEEYSQDWRQVRVFIQDFTEAGFNSFHATVTRPLIQGGFSVPVFVSHYACGDEDSADTNIQALPPQYRRPDGAHHSIRFRWRNEDDAEAQLVAALPNTSWNSGVLDFNIVTGFADDRFCDYAANDVANRRRRARIVTSLLNQATLFYLDSLRNDAHGIVLEGSHCVHNSVLHTPYQSVLHMILNPPLFRDKVIGLVPSPQGQRLATL